MNMDASESTIKIKQINLGLSHLKKFHFLFRWTKLDEIIDLINI